MSAIIFNDLAVLLTLPKSDVAEVCASAVSFINASFEPQVAVDLGKSLSSSLSGAPNPSPQQLTLCITALSKLYSESAKRKHNQHFFHKALAPFALPDDVRSSLTSVYLANQKQIFELTPSFRSSAVGGTPTYLNLDWRLDVLVGRRASHALAVPSVSVRVDVEGGENVAFEADAAKLAAMQESLEAAIRENAGTHSMRFQRYCN